MDGKEKDLKDRTTAHVAAGRGNVEVLQYMQSKGLLEAKAKDSHRGRNLALHAARSNSMYVLKNLHSLGVVDVNVTDHQGRTIATLGSEDIRTWLKSEHSDNSRPMPSIQIENV